MAGLRAGRVRGQGSGVRGQGSGVRGQGLRWAVPTLPGEKGKGRPATILCAAGPIHGLTLPCGKLTRVSEETSSEQPYCEGLQRHLVSPLNPCLPMACRGSSNDPGRVLFESWSLDPPLTYSCSNPSPTGRAPRAPGEAGNFIYGRKRVKKRKKAVLLISAECLRNRSNSSGVLHCPPTNVREFHCSRDPSCSSSPLPRCRLGKQLDVTTHTLTFPAGMST